MKPVLLDLNVLIALLWPSHEHHSAAVKWFGKNQNRGWATTPMTQAGFVRIVSNPAFSRDAVTPAEAIAVLRANLQSPTHKFWRDDMLFHEAVAPVAGRLVGHRQVSDAYLLGLAIRHGGVLATFDEGISALVDAKTVPFLEIIRG
jgi:toxin-antitoxin system PIN domain toxin